MRRALQHSQNEDGKRENGRNDQMRAKGPRFGRLGDFLRLEGNLVADILDRGNQFLDVRFVPD